MGWGGVDCSTKWKYTLLPWSRYLFYSDTTLLVNIHDCVPLNVRTQRWLFLPDRAGRLREERQHARARLHRSHRHPASFDCVWGQICSQLIPRCSAKGGGDGLTGHKHRKRLGGRERERKRERGERETPLCFWNAHIRTRTHIYIYLFVGHKRIWIHICRAGRIGWPQRLWGRRCHRAARAVWRFKTRAFLARWTRHIDAKELANYHVAVERCFATAGGCSGGWMPPVASFLACNM